MSSKIDDNDYKPREKIEELSAKLDQPAEFAKLFCAAAESQRSIDKVLKETIKELIDKDHETINNLKKYQRQVNSEDIKNSLKNIGSTVGKLLWIAVGVILTVLSKKYVP